MFYPVNELCRLEREGAITMLYVRLQEESILSTEQVDNILSMRAPSLQAAVTGWPLPVHEHTSHIS